MIPEMKFEKKEWVLRAGMAGQFIKEDSVVVDLGAGKNILKDFLKKPRRYLAVDGYKQTDETIVMDLDIFMAENIQNIVNQNIDYVVCLGLIEYLKNKERFLMEVRRLSRNLIISYFFDKDLVPNYEQTSFVKTIDDFKNLLQKTGWKVKQWEKVNNLQSHFLFICEQEEIGAKMNEVKKIVDAYWFNGKSNFGDELTWYLFNKLFNYKAVYTIPKGEKTCVLGCGSILGDKILENILVWGSGFIADTQYRVQGIPKKIFAVRGPLTRNKLLQLRIDCPELYCDAALILPDIFQEQEEIKYKLSVVPHYVDKKSKFIKICKEKNVHIIDIQYPIEQVVKEIKQSEYVLSSSLHGLIVADAFRKKSLPIIISPFVIGGDFKFLDYGYSVGNPRTRYDVNNFTVEELINMCDDKADMSLIEKGKESLKSIGKYLEEIGATRDDE